MGFRPEERARVKLEFLRMLARMKLGQTKGRFSCLRLQARAGAEKGRRRNTKSQKILSGRPVNVLHRMEKPERNKILQKIKEIEGSSLRQIARITGLTAENKA